MGLINWWRVRIARRRIAAHWEERKGSIYLLGGDYYTLEGVSTSHPEYPWIREKIDRELEFIEEIKYKIIVLNRYIKIKCQKK